MVIDEEKRIFRSHTIKNNYRLRMENLNLYFHFFFSKKVFERNIIKESFREWKLLRIRVGRLLYCMKSYNFHFVEVDCCLIELGKVYAPVILCLRPHKQLFLLFPLLLPKPLNGVRLTSGCLNLSEAKENKKKITEHKK